ncbi:MAG: Abi family protein [Firmicutes bacterium]|nr:Abi family protein [Bacillota bacterium]
MGYKTIDGLMRHLRNNGIAISGSKQKRQLVNTGYFHGYKGYRYFGKSQKRLPFLTYDEINSTIQYDTKLKSLFYDKIMFIETAIKSVALECILDNVKSENIQDMYRIIVSSYNNAPITAGVEEKKKLQQNKLNLQSMIQSYLVKAYRSNNPKIVHFYNNMSYQGVPIWALVEIMTLGDFAFMLSCFTIDTREDLSKRIGINLASDTNRELVYKYLYALKDLRNAIAHNDVVFDTRFRKIDPTKSMKKCLELEMGLPYVNFKTIGDYVILICYYLHLLKVNKTEIKAFVKSFERITNDYQKAVNKNVSSEVIHPDLPARINQLRKYLK